MSFYTRATLAFNGLNKLKTGNLPITKNANNPLNTGSKFNVHRAFRGPGGGPLNVLCVFNLCSVSRGRSSHRRCSVRKGVLKSFAIFTGKHLCWSLFF